MTSSSPLVRYSWIALLVLGCLFTGWSHQQKATHVVAVSNIGDVPLVSDPESDTGYAHGQRHLILPGHNNESYQWIMQAQLILAGENVRLRAVGYDNAPLGRPVTSPSAVRWGLAATAWLDHQVTGASLGVAVERAALWADPAAHLLLLVGVTVLVWWWFGPLAAAVAAVGLTGLFPAMSGFNPGVPDENGWVAMLATGSLLSLIGGLKSDTRSRTLMMVSGGLAGLGLWVGLSLFLPLLSSVALGVAAAALINRKKDTKTETPTPWLSWAIAGTAVIWALFLIENAPDRLAGNWTNLATLSPLYGISWLALGWVMTRLTAWGSGQPLAPSKVSFATTVLAGLAVVGTLIILNFWTVAGVPFAHPFVSRFSGMPTGAEAVNLAKWLSRDGMDLGAAATVLPILVLIPIGLALWNTGVSSRAGRSLIVLLGLLVFTVIMACQQLVWWNLFGIVALLSWIIAVTGLPTGSQLKWTVIGAFVFIPGWLAMRPAPMPNGEPQVTRLEVENLLERDLAYWLARRVGPDGGLALAPPNLTTALFYHGGLDGLGSPYRENEDGFRASVRIAGATSADEAQALVDQRRLTHVIHPSWDAFLDQYARLGAAQIEHSLMGLLNSWLPPRWLTPISYQIPVMPGFETHYAAVFEVTEVDDNATSLARLAEYFIEMDQVPLATEVSRTLAEAFASDLGSQVARAHTAIARRDLPGLQILVDEIVENLELGTDEYLLWDRRVSLAIVLAQGGQVELAREHAEMCLDEAGEYDLRFLSSTRLYRYLGLCKALDLDLDMAGMEEISLALLPPALRETF